MFISQQTVFCLLVLESLSSCKFSHVMFLIYCTVRIFVFDWKDLFFFLPAILGYQSVAIAFAFVSFAGPRSFRSFVCLLLVCIFLNVILMASRHPTLDCSTHISPRYYRILHERILPGAIAQIDRFASQAAVQLNGSTKTSLKKQRTLNIGNMLM